MDVPPVHLQAVLNANQIGPFQIIFAFPTPIVLCLIVKHAKLFLSIQVHYICVGNA